MPTLGGVGQAIGGAIGGSAGAAIGGALGGLVNIPGGGAGGSQPAIPSDAPALVATSSGANVASCPQGTLSVGGHCIDLQPGGAVSGGGLVVSGGEAVMGMFGAALAPMQTQRSVSRCIPGMVLGKDGLCYNRRDLTNKQRKWPKGRRPLLTGGELNAISKAARAAKRVKGTQKKLQRLGLLKKPTSHRRSSRGVITKSEAARALRS